MDVAEDVLQCTRIQVHAAGRLVSECVSACVLACRKSFCSDNENISRQLLNFIISQALGVTSAVVRLRMYRTVAPEPGSAASNAAKAEADPTLDGTP